MRKFFSKFAAVSFAATVLTLGAAAQETTGALQGTVKDATGAVVPGALVTVTTPTLVGVKTIKTDGRGFYRFENLPPGEYTETVTASGFSQVKRQNLLIRVGVTPTSDIALAVGGADTVVEVSSANPAIDVTSATTLTTVSSDVLDYVPRGRSYQSVIQFAPAARNEPLMGSTSTNGTGGTSPGSATNGNSYGYSVAGGSDSENLYLVEGQETANLIGGYSHTNVPVDFIDQVEINSSGVQAEHGGSLGGVVNVIMKKGSPEYHGSVFVQFENSAMDAGPSNSILYNGNPNPAAGQASPSAVAGSYHDVPVINYQPKQDHTSDLFPGFTLGGPLVPFGKLRDKLFFFVGFNPEMTRTERHINYAFSADPTLAGLGSVPFSRNTNTYYTTARVDAQISNRVRVFGSWLYQLQKQNGETMPSPDAVNGDGANFYNASVGNDPSTFLHSHGYTAPNITVNTGADITITPRLISTTRFGYYFENYHDFGYPTGNTYYYWENTVTPGSLDSSFVGSAGHQVNGPDIGVTQRNANKAIQVDQAISWTKSGWAGVHNFKFGYQLNRLSNDILQAYNETYVDASFGDGSSAISSYTPGGPVGEANCAPFVAIYGQCQGKDGVMNLSDYGTGGKATSYNHGFFAQDSWTVGHGLTLNGGLRVEKEFLPSDADPSLGSPGKPINFGWGDKIAPRVGAAWDILQNGKLKAFGGYGVYNDIMKLNLAISSFGGQYWNQCWYAVDSPNLTSIQSQFNTSGRFCPTGDTSTPGITANSTGLTFLENINNRTFPTTCSTCSLGAEGVAPGLKPYRQHSADIGVDYQASKTVVLEARWDRRRLDHVIEDAAIYNPLVGETFVIINPGQGVDDTFQDFCNFLGGTTNSSGCKSTTGLQPPSQQIQAARSYDGLELRATKSLSHHWAGMFSYTYSKFRGNYTGLTTSDISDGKGRNAPNNSRAFDEPYFQYQASGASASGLLPTDRPNTLKGYVYYNASYAHHFSTDIGLFQTIYQGTPFTSYASVGEPDDAYFQNVVGRGKWTDLTQSAAGPITVGPIRTYRAPWYNQTDANIGERFKLSGAKSIGFNATFTNVLNQHTVTSVYEQMESGYGNGSYYLRPGGLSLGSGANFYSAAMNGFPLSNALNGVGGLTAHLNNLGAPLPVSGLYGKPLSYQLPRTIRLQASFTF